MSPRCSVLLPAIWILHNNVVVDSRLENLTGRFGNYSGYILIEKRGRVPPGGVGAVGK
jgi:hypothetical protein